MGLYLVTVFILATVIFLIPRLLPGDPLRNFIDDTTLPSPEELEDLRRVHNLDGSLGQQYVRYLGRLTRLEFGTSLANSQPVSRLLRTYLPWTLFLTGSALLLSTVIGFRTGVTAAWRRGSGRDRYFQVVSTISRALPEYALGTLMVIALGVVWRIFPISGAYTPFSQDRSLSFKIVDVAWHSILPIATLTVGLLGTKFLMVRNMTIGVLGQDYMLLARAKGLPEQLQKRRHAGRNAMLPYLNLIGAQVGIAVGGGVFVQEVFGYPGIGRLMSNAVNARDFPVIEASFLMLSLIVLTANLVVDLAGSFVDPRAKSQ